MTARESIALMATHSIAPQVAVVVVVVVVVVAVSVVVVVGFWGRNNDVLSGPQQEDGDKVQVDRGAVPLQHVLQVPRQECCV